MNKRLVIFTLPALAVTGALSLGSVYAAFVVTDDAKPITIQMSPSEKLPGYYLVKDSDQFALGSSSVRLGDETTDGNDAQLGQAVALDLNAVYRIAYTNDGQTIDTTYKTLGMSYPYARNVTEGFEITYASSYQLYFKVSEGLYLVDANPSPYTAQKFYYTVNGGAAQLINGTVTGTNQAQMLGVSFVNGDKIQVSYTDNGYFFADTAYLLEQSFPFARNNADGYSFDVTYTSSYDLYVNGSGNIWLNDTNEAPYVSGAYYYTVNDGSPIRLDGEVGESGNLALKKGLNFAANDVVKVWHTEDGYNFTNETFALDVGSNSTFVAMEGEDSFQIKIASSNVDFYVNGSGDIWLEDNDRPYIPGAYYYVLNNGDPIHLDGNVSESTDLAKKLGLSFAENDVISIRHSTTGYTLDNSYKLLDEDTPFAVNQGDNQTIKFTRASTYDLVVAGNGSVVLTDRGDIPFQAGAYYYIVNGGTPVLIDGTLTDDNKAQILNVSFAAGNQVVVRHSTTGYELDEGSLSFGGTFAFGTIEGNTFTFTHASSYDLYVNGQGKIWLNDRNPAPYTANEYYAFIGDNATLLDGDVGTSGNLAQKMGMSLAKDDVVTVKYNTDGYNFASTQYPLHSDIPEALAEDHGNGSFILNRTTNNVDFYVNDQGKVWLSDHNTPMVAGGYYIAVNSGNPVRLDDELTGTNKAQKANVAFSAGDVVSIRHTTDGYSFDEGYIALEQNFPFAKQNGNTFSFSHTSSYDIYVNEQGKIWLVDRNQSPFAQGAYYYSVNGGELVRLDGDVGTSGNLAVKSNVAFSASDVVTIRHSSDGYVLDDSYYLLKQDYAYAANSGNGQTFVVNYASSYDIVIEANGKVALTDRANAPYAVNGYYYTVNGGDPIALGEGNEENYAISLGLSFSANAVIKIVHSADGYSLDSTVYPLHDDMNATFAVKDNTDANAFVIKTASNNVDLYVNNQGKVWLNDNNRPYNTNAYYVVVGSTATLLDGDVSGSDNYAAKMGLAFNEDDVVSVRHTTDGYSFDAAYPLDGYLPDEIATMADADTFVFHVTTSNCDLYLNKNHEVWFTDHDAPYQGGKYYLTVGSNAPVIVSELSEGDNYAVWNNVNVPASGQVVIAKALNDYELEDNVVLGRAYDFASVSDGKIVFSRASASYNFYWSKNDGKIYISDNTLPAAGYYVEVGNYDMYAASTKAIAAFGNAEQGDSFKVVHYDGFSSSVVTALASSSNAYATISNGLVTITGTSEYSVTVENDEIVIADAIDRPYLAYTETYYLQIGSGVPTATGATTDGNHGQWTIDIPAGGADVKFLHSADEGVSLITVYDGEGDALVNQTMHLAQGRYTIYQNSQDRIYVSTHQYTAYTDTYYVKVGDGSAVASGTPNTGDLGFWEISVPSGGANVTFLHSSDNGLTLDPVYEGESATPATNNAIFKAAGNYLVYLNGQNQAWFNYVPSTIEYTLAPGIWSVADAVIIAYSWNGVTNYSSIVTDGTFALLDDATGFLLLRMAPGSTGVDWDNNWGKIDNLTPTANKILAITDWNTAVWMDNPVTVVVDMGSTETWSDAVFLTGPDFGNWKASTDYRLTRDGGSSIWYGTFDLANGDYTYKVVIAVTSGGDPWSWQDGSNRTLVVSSAGQVINISWN